MSASPPPPLPPPGAPPPPGSPAPQHDTIGIAHDLIHTLRRAVTMLEEVQGTAALLTAENEQLRARYLQVYVENTTLKAELAALKGRAGTGATVALDDAEFAALVEKLGPG